MEIVSQYFKTVPSNPHYFFYCPPSSKKEVSWQSYVLHFPLLSCVSARLCVHISLSFTIKMSVGDYIDRKRKWFWNWKWKNIFQTTGICVSLTKEKSNLRDKWIRCEGDLCIWKPIKIHKCQLWLGKRNNSTIPTCMYCDWLNWMNLCTVAHLLRRIQRTVRQGGDPVRIWCQRLSLLLRTVRIIPNI